MSDNDHSVLPPELITPGLEPSTVIVPPRAEDVSEQIPAEEYPTVTPTKKIPSKDTVLAVTVAVLVTGAVASGAYVSGSNLQLQKMSGETVPVQVEQPVPVPEVRNPYYGLALEARAAVVYDVYDDKFLFAQNDTVKRSLASLTKIMTSVVGNEKGHNIERIAVSPFAIETEGDSGLFANETWKLRDLIQFTLMTSSNDGADAIAAAVGMASSQDIAYPDQGVDVFVQEMNMKAKELGLSTITFTNASGLDEKNGKLGGEGSAADVAKIVAYAWERHPDIVQSSADLAATFTSEDGFVHEATNTNKFVDDVGGLLGSKTGYTDYAGGNLAIIYDAGLNHPVVVVVLGSTMNGRFDDVQKLVDATHTYFTSGWYTFERSQGVSM